MVNYTKPRENVIESRVFVGAIRRDSGTYIARFIVDRVDKSAFSAHDFELVDKLANAKARKMGELTKGRPNEGLPFLDSPTASVADLLKVVNELYYTAFSAHNSARYLVARISAILRAENAV